MASRLVPVMRITQAFYGCAVERMRPSRRLPSGPGRARAARQIKQIIVSRRTVYRQLVTRSLYEKVANPIPVSPDRYPTGLASSAAGSFPRVGRT